MIVPFVLAVRGHNYIRAVEGQFLTMIALQVQMQESKLR